MTDRRSTVATVGDRGVRTRSFALDQRIRYSYSAPVTDLRQYLRIVPPADHGRQRRLGWQLSVEGVASSTQRTFSDPWGNTTIAVTAPRVDEFVEFVVHAEVEVAVDVETGTSPAVEISGRRSGTRVPGAVRGSLGPTPLTAADDLVRDLAGDLCGDQGKDLPDAASLCDRVHSSIAYEWGITGVHTTAAEALAGGRGVCQDYAHIMLAVCRLAGVPARYVSGHLTGEGGSHAWVEVLRPQPGRPGTWAAEGWDPTHNRRTGADYLVVAVGRDYSDAAPLWGTFEGDGVSSTLVVDKRLSA